MEKLVLENTPNPLFNSTELAAEYSTFWALDEIILLDIIQSLV